LPNSTLLLCSDGLSDMLKSADMTSVLQKDVSLKEKVRDLIDFANDKGGKDNITVVLAEVISDESQPAKTGWGDFSREEITVEQRRKTKPAKNRKKGVWILFSVFVGILLLAAIAAGVWFGRDYYENLHPDFIPYPPAATNDTLVTSLKNDTLIVNDSIKDNPDDSENH